MEFLNWSFDFGHITVLVFHLYTSLFNAFSSVSMMRFCFLCRSFVEISGINCFVFSSSAVLQFCHGIWYSYDTWFCHVVDNSLGHLHDSLQIEIHLYGRQRQFSHLLRGMHHLSYCWILLSLWHLILDWYLCFLSFIYCFITLPMVIIGRALVTRSLSLCITAHLVSADNNLKLKIVEAWLWFPFLYLTPCHFSMHVII